MSSRAHPSVAMIDQRQQHSQSPEEEDFAAEEQLAIAAGNQGPSVRAVQLALPANHMLDFHRLNYSEYFKRIQELVEQFHQHWQQEQRVKTLKTIIQLTKLLADTSQVKLYANKYKIITDTLDAFGQMIYERVHRIAESYDGHQDEVLSAEEAYELAKDICRNWFLKVASIRELVPRFYCELAILKACDILIYQRTAQTQPTPQMGNFHKQTYTLASALEAKLFSQSLERLAKSAWGFGDPIVALHARAYHSKVSERLIGWHPQKRMKEDILFGLMSRNLANCVELIWMLNIGRQLEQLRRISCEDAGAELPLTPTAQEAAEALAFRAAGQPELEAEATQKNRKKSAVLARFMTLIDLISGPLQSILGQFTLQFQESCSLALEPATRDQTDEAEGKQKLEFIMGQVLLAEQRRGAKGESDQREETGGAGKRKGKGNTQGGERATDDHLFAQNVILHSICRALPNELVAEHAHDLFELLESTFALWDAKQQERGLRQLQPQPHTTGAADIDSGQRGSNRNRGVALVNGHDDVGTLLVCSFYTTLNSFLLALAGSDTFQMAQGHETILESGAQMVEKLLRFELQQQAMGADVGRAGTSSLSANYLKCFKAIMSFASHYGLANACAEQTNGSVSRLLAEFVAKIQGGRRYAAHYGDILDLIKTIFTNRTNLHGLKQIFGWKSFRQLLEFLHRDEHKLEASRWILETVRANIKLSECKRKASKEQRLEQSETSCTERGTIASLLRLFAMLNDSLSPLTALDDLQHLERLVVFYLDLIHIENHHERLEFYVRCRSSLANLDAVLEFLVRKVLLELPQEYRRFEKRRAARQRFLNACLAYAFATIPAITHRLVGLDGSKDDEQPYSNSSSGFEGISDASKLLIRLTLYIQGTRLALEHMSLSLGDFYMKQTIAILSRLFKLEQQQGERSGTNVDTAAVMRQKCATLLRDLASKLLNLVINHQDHIDLKHKLALISLIRNRETSSEHSIGRDGNILLLQSLRLISGLGEYDIDQADHNAAAASNVDRDVADLQYSKTNVTVASLPPLNQAVD